MRVDHSYILLLNRVLLWLDPHLPRMSFKVIRIQRDTGLAEARRANMSAPRQSPNVEYPSPNMKNPPRSPRRSLYTAPHPCPPLVGCLPSSHAIGTQRDTGLADSRWYNMSAPLSDATPHHTNCITSLCLPSWGETALSTSPWLPALLMIDKISTSILPDTTPLAG
uniref:Uncharacterized protein n=1 Tax=Mesocestoides corti TaxID=53468 RepID=A0A5K3G533_MESCO